MAGRGLLFNITTSCFPHSTNLACLQFVLRPLNQQVEVAVILSNSKESALFKRPFWNKNLFVAYIILSSHACHVPTYTLMGVKYPGINRPIMKLIPKLIANVKLTQKAALINLILLFNFFYADKKEKKLKTQAGKCQVGS